MGQERFPRCRNEPVRSLDIPIRRRDMYSMDSPSLDDKRCMRDSIACWHPWGCHAAYCWLAANGRASRGEKEGGSGIKNDKGWGGFLGVWQLLLSTKFRQTPRAKLGWPWGLMAHIALWPGHLGILSLRQAVVEWRFGGYEPNRNDAFGGRST